MNCSSAWHYRLIRFRYASYPVGWSLNLGKLILLFANWAEDYNKEVNRLKNELMNTCYYTCKHWWSFRVGVINTWCGVCWEVEEDKVMIIIILAYPHPHYHQHQLPFSFTTPFQLCACKAVKEKEPLLLLLYLIWRRAEEKVVLFRKLVERTKVQEQTYGGM